MALIPAAAASKFLFGFAQKAIVAAIKKAKEQADARAAEGLDELLKSIETGKPLATKLAQRITVSLKSLKVADNVVERLRSLDQDAILQTEFVAAYLSGVQVEDEWVRLLVAADPVLTEHALDLRKLAATWLEAVDYAAAQEPVLLGALVLRGQRSQQTTLHALSAQIAGAELRQAEQTEAQTQTILVSMQTMLSSQAAQSRGLPMIEAEAGQATSVLKSQHQRTFDAARDELLFGSVLKAENAFRTLIADLGAAGTLGDQDLLFRAHVNLSTCLLERKEIEAASEVLDLAAKLRPNDLRVKRHRAVYLSRTGKSEEALSIVRGLRALEPEKIEHTRNEIALLLDLNRIPEAIAILEDDPQTDADHWSQLSMAYQRSGDASEALVAARRACELGGETEGPWIALAYALGFPIIERRMQGKTRALTADNDELSQLREAIAAAEKAADILRKRERVPVLAEVLTNLTAFYSALGDEAKSLALGIEVRRLGDNSPIALQNLYYAQMRSGDPGGALETAKAIEAACGGRGRPRWREANALLALGKTDEVLGICAEAANAVQTPDATAEWTALAAGALADSHRSEQALRLLEDAISKNGHAALYLERARIFSELHKFEDAAAAFAQAERISGPSSQASLDYGLFHYRRGNWAEALTRLETFGASSVVSPLHQRYLICLYNTGDYARCQTLIQQWQAEDRGFDETIYSLAARCHQFADNIVEARDALETLLKHGGQHSFTHRKMLGYIYFRLDELETAYDLLTRAVVERPEDVDARVLLSHISVARGRFQEALENAHAAVLAAPESVQARSAFFSAMLGLPSEFQPAAELVTAHHENLQQLAAHPSGVLRAVPIDADLREFREMLKGREKQVTELDRLYRGNNLPFGFLAKQSGTPLFELWRSAIHHPELGVRMSLGDQIAQDGQVASASKSVSVVVDLPALFTLQGLGLLDVLPKLYPNIYAHVSLLDEIITHRRQLEQHPPSGRFASIKGQLIHTEANPSDISSVVAALGELRDFLKGNVHLVGLTPSRLVDDRRQVIESACGVATVMPIFVAKERAAALYSDDLVVRGMAEHESGVNGFCSQAVLRAALARGVITREAYEDAILQLWEWHYGFVSEGVETLVRAYDLAGGCVTPSIERLLRRTEKRECNLDSSTPILAGFLAFVWATRRQGGESREKWAQIIWETFIRANPSHDLLRQFLVLAAARLVFLPECFFGAVFYGTRIPDVIPFARAVAVEALAIGGAFTSVLQPTLIADASARRKWADQRSVFALRFRLDNSTQISRKSPGEAA